MDVDARANGEGANRIDDAGVESDAPRLVFATVSQGTVMMHAATDASVGIRTVAT